MKYPSPKVKTLMDSISFWADKKAAAVRECKYDHANQIQIKIDRLWARVNDLIEEEAS